MTPFIRGVVEATAAAFTLPAPILEVGSYQVEGQEELIDVRRLFPGQPYVGIDLRAGPGVDRVENVESLTLPSHSFGTVLALSTLEHVRRFWNGVEELLRVLRPDGVLLISCPFYFHIHAYPSDYWRFTPEALDALLEEECPQRILGWHGPAKRPANVWAVAFGPEHPAITPDQISRYQQELRRRAKHPRQPGRTLRYRLAQLLCGSGPFRPHLQRDQFAIEWRQGKRTHAA